MACFVRIVMSIALVTVIGATATGCGSANKAITDQGPVANTNTGGRSSTKGRDWRGQHQTRGQSRCVSGSRTPCRVLFIGNSYTYVNNLPAMLATLARSGHEFVRAAKLATANATLADHAASHETREALDAARWNVVVLQEQSQIPSIERLRQADMYPAARQLVRMVREVGAEPMFYLTAARREGWPEDGLDNYTAMQVALDEGYLLIGRELHVAIAPVGYAWSVAVSHEHQQELWQSDGSHPTVEGTYLAACVFYASIFHKSPNGLAYHAGLSPRVAAREQAIASRTVLPDPREWELK